jgi:hypothetical protein
MGSPQQASGPVAGLTTTISLPHDAQRSRVPAPGAVFMGAIFVLNLPSKQAIG